MYPEDDAGFADNRALVDSDAVRGKQHAAGGFDR